MEILFVRNLFRPADLGGNRYPFEVTRRLALRHAVRVVTPRFGGALPGTTSVRFSHYPVSRRTPLETFVTNAIFSRLWSEAEILRRRPDIVILSSYDVAFARFFAFRTHVPTMYIYHSSFYSPAVDKIAKRRWPLSLGHPHLASFLSYVERTVFEHANAIVAVSPFSEREIQERLGRSTSRVRVISTGVDTARFSPGDRALARQRWDVPQGALLLTTVGRLAPVKRYDRAMDVLDMLRERGHDAVLAIAGTGPDERRLRQHARTKRSYDRIRFVGFVDGEALVDLYRASDVVLNTSEFENWSLAMLEALAAGAAVVATPRGSSPDMLRPIDPALVASGTDPEQISDAVEAILRGRIEELRVVGRARVTERFSWEQAVAELETFISTTVRDATQRTLAR